MRMDRLDLDLSFCLSSCSITIGWDGPFLSAAPCSLNAHYTVVLWCHFLQKGERLVSS